MLSVRVRPALARVVDPVAGRLLRAGVSPGAGLEEEIRDFVRTRLAAYEYPRRIAFVDELPMTATGKIMRRVLRQRAAEAR